MTKTALITGASSGIGLELAHIHAKTGGNLILVARSADKLEALQAELKQKYGTTVRIIIKDLTETNAGAAVYHEIKKANIVVDYLINNAGFGGTGKFHMRDLATDLSMIQLNITALVELTHYFISDFVARGDGKVLQVSSTAAKIPGPLQATYFATKAFVTSFSNALSEELRGTGVTVTALMPGATDTEFGRVSGMDKTMLFDTPANAQKVAQQGYNAMLLGKINQLSGLSFSQKILMKITPFAPIEIILKQVKQMQTEIK